MVNSRKIYINGIGIVSPAGPVTEHDFDGAAAIASENILKCPDPGYRQYIPADMIRRMARIIRMGVTASGMCLHDAARMMPESDQRMPDAIITGTGWGCLEDTEKFLSAVTGNHEQLLTPTSFIQSTHNTVAGQIALLLKCHGYNFTYVQRGISFESALLDAILQLRADECRHVLAGGCDEITAGSLAVLARLGMWKRKPVASGQLFTDAQRGTIAGEGAAFFSLHTMPAPSSYAELAAATGFRKPAGERELAQHTTDFLHSAGVEKTDIDLILTGKNGDPSGDRWYNIFISGFPATTGIGNFKHLCGEYPTASSFGMAIAAFMLKTQRIPEHIANVQEHSSNQIRNILIYNHYQSTHHALILLRQTSAEVIREEKEKTEVSR